MQRPVDSSVEQGRSWHLRRFRGPQTTERGGSLVAEGGHIRPSRRSVESLGRGPEWLVMEDAD